MAVINTDHDLYFVADWSTNPADFNESTDRGKKLLDVKKRLLDAGLKEEEIVFGSTEADLAAGANVFIVSWMNGNDNTRRIAIEGKEVRASQEVTCYFIDVTRGSASRWDLRGDYYNIYVDGAGTADRWFYAIPSVDNKNTDADGRTGFRDYEIRNGNGYGPLTITIKNSNFSDTNNDSGIFILSRGVQEEKLYSDLKVTIENTRAGHINLGNGSVGWNDSNYKGWIYGSIEFTIKDTQIFNQNEASWVNKGGVGMADKPATVTGEVINSYFQNDFRGLCVTMGSGSKDYGNYASYDLTLSGSTARGIFSLGWVENKNSNNRWYGVPYWEGSNVMHVSGSTAASFRGWISKDAAHDPRARVRTGHTNSYTIEISDFASEDPNLKKTVATEGLLNWDVITIKDNAIVEVGALGNSHQRFTELNPEEDKTQEGSIVTVAAGASVTATSATIRSLTVDATANVRISGAITGNVAGEGEKATITLAKENILSAGSFSNIDTLTVTSTSTEKEVVLVSGVTAYVVGDSAPIKNVILNGETYNYGIFGGQYSLVGTDLVAHQGITYAVNSAYTDDAMTALGIVGYSTLSAAQAKAATNDASIVFIKDAGLPEESQLPTFTADVNTLGIETQFVGDSTDALDLGGNSIIVGGSDANATASMSYIKNVKNVKIGAVTGKATVLIDNAIQDGDVAGIETIGLEGSAASAKISVSDSVVGAIDFTTGSAAAAEITVSGVTADSIKTGNKNVTGTMTLANSTVESVYGGEGGLVVTGSGNTIGTVYAENNAANLKLGDSEVKYYVAGLSSAAAKRDTLAYNDGVSAEKLVLGDATINEDGDVSGVANEITKVDATITGGEIKELYIGADGNTIGTADVEISGGSFDKFVYGNGLSQFNLTLSGGTAITFMNDVPTPAPDADPTKAPLTDDRHSVFYGIVYGGSFTALDGAVYNDSDEVDHIVGNTLTVKGNAKAGSVKNFKELLVTGGTLNVAGSREQEWTYPATPQWAGNLPAVNGTAILSVLSDDNVLDISGNITNRRGIQAGNIKAQNLTNSGLIGTYRAGSSNTEIVGNGITLTGDLNNSGYIKTSVMSVAGNFDNSGKITVTGGVTVGGATVKNSGEFFFRSTVDNTQAGTFHQVGGLTLTAANLENTGFLSAGYLKGVANLTTSKMYVTGGAEITGAITITAGSEVAFTDKALNDTDYESDWISKIKDAGTALILGGGITIADSSNLVVSGKLTTKGAKTITITVTGDKLIGANEIVKAESGVNDWTINWKSGELIMAENEGPYSVAKTATSITIYSQDELYINSSYTSEVYATGDKVKVNGKTFLYGMNIFGTVEEAVSYAQTHTAANDAKLRIWNDTYSGEIAAAGYDVIIDNSTVGDITAKTVNVVSDSTLGFVTADTMTVASSACATVNKIASATNIVVDASKGSGSRLVIDADPEKYELDLSKVTVVSPEGKAYGKTVLGGDGAHKGDLYITSTDNAYAGPALFKTVQDTDAEGKPKVDGEGKPVMVVKPAYADGEGFDAVTGDALFYGEGGNVYSERAQAEAAATAAGGTAYLVGYTTDDAELKKTAGVNEVFEVAAGGTAALSGAAVYGGNDVEFAGGSVGTVVYGISKTYETVTGDLNFTMNNVTTSQAVNVAGDDKFNVMNGNINAEITNSRIGSSNVGLYIGRGSFGTEETKPIDINVTVRDSYLGAFYGIQTETTANNQTINTEIVDPNPDNKQLINANINIKIYDSVVGGTVTAFNTNNAHWNGYGATLLQTYFTSGGINMEIGNTDLGNNNIRAGISLEGAGKAVQANNVKNTLHIVATDKGSTTTASYLCEWDTIIVDATAKLWLNTLQYTTTAIGPKEQSAAYSMDGYGTLTQVMINMSGYEKGTHTVIEATRGDNGAGQIYTDDNLSNITVIGDNDFAGRCVLAYDLRGGQLKKIVVFDKADDMYVNTSYTADNNGDEVGQGARKQELLFEKNAHTKVEDALVYADEWHGTIVVTGGSFSSEDFHGNNVELNAKDNQAIVIDKLSMGDVAPNAPIKDERANMDATLTIVKGATVKELVGSSDSLKSSTLNINGDAKLGDIEGFTAINVKKGLTLALGVVSDANIAMAADNELTVKSLTFADATTNLTVDVAGYSKGKSHVLIASEEAFGGEEKISVWSSDAGAKKPTDPAMFQVKRVDNDIVLVNFSKNDAYLNSKYTTGFTGVRDDGTFLQATTGAADEKGINAFANTTDAVKGLGGEKFTLTMTANKEAGDVNEITGNIYLGGANFVMEDGILNGNVYACIDINEKETFYSNKTYSINGKIVGSLDLTAADGIFYAKKSTVSFGPTTTVTGNVIGGGDTTLTINGGKSEVGGLITGFSNITLSADSYLKTSGLSLSSNSAINLKNIDFAGLEGNYRLVIDSDTDINVNVNKYTGIDYYNSGKQLYVFTTEKVFFNANWTKEEVDGQVINGNLLVWGKNAFGSGATQAETVANFNAAVKATKAVKGTLIIDNGAGTVDITADGNTNGQPVSLKITNSKIPVITNGLFGTPGDANEMTNGNQYVGDVRVDIDSSTVNYDGGGVLVSVSDRWGGNNWQHRNTITGNVNINVTNSTIGQANNAVRRTDLGTFLFFGKEMNVNFTNTTIYNDLRFMGDITLPSGDTVNVNFTSVSVPDPKWWWFTEGTPGGYGGTINVTIKDSTFGNRGYTNFKFAIQNGNAGNNVENLKINFNVSGSTVWGDLNGGELGYNAMNSNPVITVTGENYIHRLLAFNKLNMDADASITGSTVALKTATVTIDATGYTGGTKVLISTSNVLSGVSGASVTVMDGTTSTVSDKYAVAYGTRGMVLTDGSDGTLGDLFYDVNGTARTGTTSADGTIFIFADDIKSSDDKFKAAANVFADFDVAKTKLKEGKKLYAAIDDALLSGNSNAVYATIDKDSEQEDVEVTPFVNLVVMSGNFTELDGENVPTLAVAAEGKTVTGNATIEIAGGSFGKAEVSHMEGEGEDEHKVVDSEAVIALIDGSNDVVGGKSNLVISKGGNMYATITNFDNMTVAANITVSDDIAVAEGITIDATKGGFLKAEKGLTAQTITIDATGYTGGSKKVIDSAALAGYTEAQFKIVGEDVDLYFNETDGLYLVSEGIGNIFFNDAWHGEADVNGTEYKPTGDLLMWNTNAFGALSADTFATKTSKDFTAYILNGDFSATALDLSTVGQFNLQVEGGKLGTITLADNSTVKITATTAAVSGTFAGSAAEDAKGYSLVLDPATAGTAISSASGVNAVTVNAANAANLTVGAINYVAAGGNLTVDFKGYTAGEAQTATLLGTKIEGFLTEDNKKTVATTNNADKLMVYYSDVAGQEGVKVVKRGHAAFYDQTADNSVNGTTEDVFGVQEIKVFGDNNNVSDHSIANLAANLSNGDVLVVKGANRDVSVDNKDLSAIIKDSTVGTLRLGFNSNSHERTGSQKVLVENSTISGEIVLAGSGTDNDNRITIKVGDEGEGGYDYTFVGGGRTDSTNKVRVTENANVSGTSVSVTFKGAKDAEGKMVDYVFGGDMELFNNVRNGDSKLETVNVTFENVTAPRSKWMWIWDPRESNSTTINLTVTDSVFDNQQDTNSHDTALGILGNDVSDWSGTANVTVSGVTSTGRISAARGIGSNAGDAGQDQGFTADSKRNLFVKKSAASGNGVSDIYLTNMFSEITIADDAFLTGNSIAMSAENTGFVLQGDAAKAATEGDKTYLFKEYAHVSGSITGSKGAKFVDSTTGEEIEGYAAISGATSVFVYKPGSLGDIFYSSSFTASVNGLGAKNHDGSDTVLVYGDNAVSTLDDAYAKLEGTTDLALQINGGTNANVYAKGYMTIVNAGTITNLFGGNEPVVTVEGEEAVETITPAAEVTTGANLTVNSGAVVTNITVSDANSKVSGAATVTIGEGTKISGDISAGDNATSSLVFNGDATAKSIAGFQAVTIQADSVVTLKEAFSGAAITVDATGFTGYDKIVMTAKSFGEVLPTITAGDFSGKFIDLKDDKGEVTGKALVLSTGLVNDTYADAAWVEGTTLVVDGIIRDDKNSFNSVTAAANAIVKEDATLYIVGGDFGTQAVTLAKGNDVVVEAAATIGDLATAGTLTVDTNLTASSISGISGLTLNAGEKAALTVSGALALAKDATLTINVGETYTQNAAEVVALATEGGITVDGVELEDGTQITLAGAKAGGYYAYYDKTTQDVIMLKLDTLYLSGDWTEQNHPATYNGETLIWGENAFDRMNATGAKLVDGQKLWIIHRTGQDAEGSGSIHTGGPEMAEGEDGKFLSEIRIAASTNATTGEIQNGSLVARIVVGGTNGEHQFFGDTHVIVDHSTIAITGTGDNTESNLVSTVISSAANGNAPWDHRNTLYGNVTVDVTDSSLGSATTAGGVLRIMQYTYVVDASKEEKSAVNVNFTNTDVYKDVYFLGDSPMGKDVARASYSRKDEADDGIGTTETLNINLNNVTVSNNRQWAIRGGGSQEIVTGGKVTVNMTGTTFGENSVFAIEENWSGADGIDADLPRCGSDFTFNLTDSEINGYLVAGRMNYSSALADLAGVDGYYGARVLNVNGSNFVKNALYFKEINLTGDSSLQGDSVVLFSGEGRDAEGKATQVDGKINLDLTGYEGVSRVILDLNFTYDDDGNISGGGISKFNIKKNLNVIGNEAAEGEGERYELMTDYDVDTNTISKIVIKGEIKDLYVDVNYDPEEFELGTSYKLTGEALFFGENAFNSMVDVVDEETEEVTHGALYYLKADPTKVLHIAGSGVSTEVLYSNSITIDAGTSLIYNGADAITVNGTVNVAEGGLFTIIGKAIATGGVSDFTVLTADAINFTTKEIEDAIKVSSPLYDTVFVGKADSTSGKDEVHMVLKADNVYVNTAWPPAEYDDPETKEFTLADGTKVYYGFTAFNDADLALSKVSEKGTLTVLDSNVSFTNAISNGVNVVADGATITNTTVGDLKTATLTLKTGSTAGKINVMNGSTLVVESGVTVTAGEGIDAEGKTVISVLGLTTEANATFAEGSTLDFNIVGQVSAAGARVSNLYRITGTPNFTVTIDASIKDGSYKLASGAATETFDLTGTSITLKTGDATYDALVVNAELATKVDALGAYFKVAVVDGDLTLTKEASQDVIYVNSLWEEGKSYKVDGADVTVGGEGANGFINGDDAVAKAKSSGATLIKVNGGVVKFTNGVEINTLVQTGATLNDTDVKATLTVSNGATLAGKSVFNPGEEATITIDGTVAFVADEATKAAAQITDLGKATFGDNVAFTLAVDGEVAAGDVFLLATGVAESFANDYKVQLAGTKINLTVGATENVGDLGYKLTLENGNLNFNVVNKVVPAIVYVNSEWPTSGEVTLSDGITKAVMGENAFKTYDLAVKTGTSSILVDGGTVSFGTGASVLDTVVGKDATLVNASNFAQAITINGTVLFDTAFASEGAQISGFDFISGETTYMLVEATKAGEYVLASDVTKFESTIGIVDSTFTLNVGDVDKEIGSFKYTLELTEAKTLVLTVAGEQPPTPVVTKAYVNSDWAGQSGEVDVPGGKATIGTDAFATIAEAEGVATVTDIEVVGGKTAIAEGDTYAITIDADATLSGKFTATENITVNGTFVFDTAIATDAAAQLTGYSSLKGNAKFALTDVVKADETKTYILATDADSFDKAITVNGEKDITVGGEAQRVAGYDYSIAIDDNNSLVLTVEKYVKPTDLPTHVYVNNTWPTSGTVTLSDGVTEATIGIDAFLTYGDAFNGVKEGGTITVDGGEISFPNGVEVSVTNEVGANATLAGKSEFASAITVNGTILFAAADAGADEANAQIKGFGFISGNATYQLSALSAGEGTYYLATGLNGNFTGAVELLTGTEEPVYLTVSGGAAEFGDYTYQLGYTDNNALTVTIAKKSGPTPPPTPTTTIYVNSDWSDTTKFPVGTVVTVKEGVNAVIGTDAFATADQAVGASTEDSTIEVLKGEASFSGPVKEPVTIDEAATLTGKVTFIEGGTVTVNGGVAFDTKDAADGAQITGFSNVILGETATLTLAAEAKEAGSSVVLATDAASMYKQDVTGNDGFVYTVGSEKFAVINGVSYVLDLDQEDNLALSYVACTNTVDDGTNNWLYDKKTKTVNDAVRNLVGTTLSADSFREVLVDTKGSVYDNGYYNFVNSTDTVDFTKFTLTDATRLSFTIKATDKVKATIYQLVYNTAKATYTLKSLKSASVSVKKGAAFGQVDTKAILLAPGEYYVAVQSTNKKASSVFYNVTMNETSNVFVDDDDSTNDYLFVGNKAKNGLSDRAKANTLVDNVISGSVMEGAKLQIDDETTSEEGWDNFVGFGDVADVARVSPNAPAALNFSVTATDKVKLIVYRLTLNSKGAWTAKAIKTKTLSKAGTVATGTLLLDRLAVPAADTEGVTGYYVAVQSTNANKGAGGNAYYNVTATGTLYEDADNGENNWLLQSNTVNDKLVKNDDLAAVAEIKLDEVDSSSEEYSNFVGFGDASDYAEFTVAESGKYFFALKSDGKAKLVVYSVTESKGKLKSKSMLTVTAKAAGTTPSTKGIDLVAGTKYFVSVQATDAKKGAAVNYDVQLALNGNFSSSALDMPESAVADTFKQDDLFASQTVDAFADAAAFNADSQLIDEKQSWQSLAALA